jgi:hypothetical protein
MIHDSSKPRLAKITYRKARPTKSILVRQISKGLFGSRMNSA